MPEAGVAHRIAGLTSLYYGDYTEARTWLEKALDILDSERDRDLAFRFGQDQVAGATIYSGRPNWPLGDRKSAAVCRSGASIKRQRAGMCRRSIYVNYHLCFFEAVRRDRRRTLPLAEAVLDLAASGYAYMGEAWPLPSGWANWRIGDRQTELAEMRHGVERWRELGQGSTALFARPLAEAEADRWSRTSRSQSL